MVMAGNRWLAKKAAGLVWLVFCGQVAWKILNASRNSSPTADSARTIVLVGLPRTGSLAIHEFAECQGYTSFHYCCPTQQSNNLNVLPTKFPCGPHAQPCGTCILKNLQANRSSPWEECGGVASNDNDNNAIVWSQFHSDIDVVNGQRSTPALFLPQHFALPFFTNDDTSWILTTRSSGRQWASSMVHWYGTTQRILATFGGAAAAATTGHPSPPAANAKVTHPEILSDLQHRLDASVWNQSHALDRPIQQLQDIYDRHVSKIRQWKAWAGIPSFLEIDMDADPTTNTRLLRAFLPRTAHAPKGRPACHWHLDVKAYDDDWKNFSLFAENV